MLEHCGYDIRVFNLIDMLHSNNYNPFNYIYDVDGKYSATAVIKMVNVLMKNTQKEGGGSSDQFWDDSTKALLAALCFYLVECEDKSRQNFSEVMKLLKKAEVKEGDDAYMSDLDLIFDALENPEKYTQPAVAKDERVKALNIVDLVKREEGKKTDEEKKQKKPRDYMCLKYYKDFKKAAGDIRDLFFVPKYNKNGVMKQEFTKYMANIEHYPFQMYIHWQPADVGSIVYSDRKFLKIIYGQHNDSFTDYTKYRDADDETRNNIYSFIDSAEKTAIAVDCENSNPYKLYSVLKGLNPEELARIEKITLYDDPNTTTGWDWLSKFTQIPTEHIEIDRVTDRKSLVDVRMTASVVTDFYRDGITSFIIVSSDSDFLGLIESLPKAKFLVMYEYEKCGTAIKNALAQHGIYYCAIDDFCTAGTEDMKRAVLFAELEKHLPSLVGENPLDLTHKIYEATRVIATMKEMENFCNRYVKTLRLKVNSEGVFVIEIQK